MRTTKQRTRKQEDMKCVLLQTPKKDIFRASVSDLIWISKTLCVLLCKCT